MKKPIFKVAKIKNSTTQYISAAGVEILFIDLGIAQLNKIVDRPINLEDYDRFYSAYHQELYSEMKYKDFLINELDDNCDLPYKKINIKNLENIRVAIKSDFETADRSYLDYIKNNQLDVSIPNDFYIE